LPKHPKSRATLLAALYFTQEQFDWLSPEAIQHDRPLRSAQMSAVGGKGVKHD
jgi:hypothetical protein